MVSLNVENCNNKEFLDKVNELLNSFSEELSGSITIDIKEIKHTNKTIFSKWKLYCAKASRYEESDYISEWSQNNDEIKSISRKNVLLSKLTSIWSGNKEKHESVDMIEELGDFCLAYLKISTEDILSMIDNNEDLTKLFDMVKKNKELKHKNTFQEILTVEDFKNKFLEIIELFYSRNPLFKYDW